MGANAYCPSAVDLDQLFLNLSRVKPLSGMTKQRKEPRTRAAHIRDFLAENPAATRCLQQQRRDDKLLERLRGLLAPEARAHCIQVHVSDGELTIIVDSTAWATRLRYQAPDLAQSLADTGITQIRLRARPRAQEQRSGPAPRHTKLTPAVVNHLMEAADGTADAGLAELFRRLARRHRGPGESDA
jgi:hypothetical protein